MYVCALTWVVKTSEVCECVCVYECVLCVSFHVPCVVFFHSTCSLPHFYLFTQSLISQIKKKTLVFLFFFNTLLSFFTSFFESSTLFIDCFHCLSFNLQYVKVADIIHDFETWRKGNNPSWRPGLTPIIH